MAEENKDITFRPIIELHQETFDQELGKFDKPVLVVITSPNPGCVGCRIVERAIDTEYAKTYEGRLVFTKFNGNSWIVDKFQLPDRAPAFLLFDPKDGKAGRPVKTWHGYGYPNKFIDQLNEGLELVKGK